IPVLHAVATTFERVLYIERRTVAIGGCYLASAAATLGLNAVLIPSHPFYGAALATDLGMGLLAGLLWQQTRGVALRVRLATTPMTLATLAAIGAAVIVRHALPADSGLIGLPLGALCVAVVFVGVCVVGGLIPSAERQAFAHF